MGLLTRLERVAGHIGAHPTIDDWVLEGGEEGRREVTIRRNVDTEYVNGQHASLGKFKCTLVGYRKGVYFNAKGYGDTTGDSFVNTLRRLNESGVMG